MTTRSRWLLPVLVVLLVTVPILEVWLLIQVGQVIGVAPTLAILVAEALVGGWLMRREGSRAWRALVEAFQRGRMPVTELTNAALVLVGGVLLLLPGFATDLVGLICLLPFTRPLVRRVLSAILSAEWSSSEWRRYGRDSLTTSSKAKWWNLTTPPRRGGFAAASSTVRASRDSSPPGQAVFFGA